MLITERLAGDHRSFLELLARLEAACAEPRNPEVRDYQCAFAMLVPLMSIHELAEDRLFFPFLCNVSNSLKKSVHKLSGEHDRIHVFARELMEYFSRQRLEPHELCHLNKEFVGLMREHIQSEEALYPEIEAAVDRNTLENLGRDLDELLLEHIPAPREWAELRPC